MKKDLGIIFGLFLLIVVLLVFGQGFTTTSFLKGNEASGQAQVRREIVPIKIAGLSVDAKVAVTPSERKGGLSKMDSLPLSEGMLFVFENSGSYGIWMKDMKFAIDIIWISEDRRIADIAENVPPEPGKKESELKIYRPRAPAKYILEINAGLSALHDLQIGNQVNFEL